MSNVQVAEGIGRRLQPAGPMASIRSLGSIARKKPLGFAGATIFLLLTLAAIFAPVIAPYDPYIIAPPIGIFPPSVYHLMGTDQTGRDLFSRILYGSTVSMSIGIFASMLSTTISSFLGTFSAFRGGKWDLVLQRFVDAIQALPTLVLLLAAMFVFERGVMTLIILIGVLFGIRSSRVVRGAALSIMQNEYVLAARALGASDWRILTRYVMPNVFAPIMVLTTVQVGGVISNEASLSFLGLGVLPPTITWGQMLGSTYIPYMVEAPWLVIFPGLAITAVVWGSNMAGDALRDLVDPRLRGSR